MFTFLLSVARLPHPILEYGVDLADIYLFDVSHRHNYYAGYSRGAGRRLKSSRVDARSSGRALTIVETNRL